MGLLKSRMKRWVCCNIPGVNVSQTLYLKLNSDIHFLYETIFRTIYTLTIVPYTCMNNTTCLYIHCYINIGEYMYCYITMFVHPPSYNHSLTSSVTNIGCVFYFVYRLIIILYCQSYMDEGLGHFTFILRRKLNILWVRTDTQHVDPAWNNENIE